MRIYFEGTKVQQIKDEIERKKMEKGLFGEIRGHLRRGPHVHMWLKRNLPRGFLLLLSHSHFRSLSLSFSLFFFASLGRKNQTKKKKIQDNHHRAISLGRSTHIAILSSSLLLLHLRSAIRPTTEPRARHQSRGEKRRASLELRRAPPARNKRVRTVQIV